MKSKVLNDRAVAATIWCGALVYLGYRMAGETGWTAMTTAVCAGAVAVVLVSMVLERLPKAVRKVCDAVD